VNVRGLKQYSIRIPLQGKVFLGGKFGYIHPHCFIGLLKGLAKIGGKIIIDIPDEQQVLDKFVEFRIFVPKESILDWKKQIRRYGIQIEETTKAVDRSE